MPTYTYKNARLAVGTSYSQAYICPTTTPPTTAVVAAVQGANVHATDSVKASLQWLDSSASNAATRLVNALPIPIYDAQSLLAAPLVLEAGDELQAKASATSSLELTVSITEIT